jgi:TolB-like protein/Tfp pilus assembly protein PilF
MSAPPDIFLSYNREDVAIAKVYADAFVREGLEVWWDATLRSGEAYDKVTEAALRGAKAVVVLWSPRSVESRWVRAEATIADRNKTLMPLTIEPCERPVMFELTQTADLAHWRGAADDRAWLAFLDDVRRMVGRGDPTPAKATPAPAPAPAGSGKPIVAVIPFAQRAGDEELAVLAEDLTEEITREMAHQLFLEVVAASTMSAWRGKAINNQALGRELDARYLVEGKLQRAGEDVRLTVQLIEADTSKMVWSSRTTRRLTAIAGSPEEFPGSVAAEVGERIIQIEASRAMAKPGPYSGWEHVLRARAYMARHGSDSVHRIIEEARLAVAAAPDFGFAHAILALALAELTVTYGERLDDARSHEIQAHVQRAMQLDGDEPTVIQTLINAYIGLAERETALRLARRAVALYPNSPFSYHVLGIAYLALGRTADVIAALTRQDCLTPVDLTRYLALAELGICHLLEGRPEEAEEMIDRALALHPDFHVALKWKAIVAAHRGKEAEAIATVRRLRDVEPTMSIDQHVWQIVQHPKLAECTTEEVATLRRLWSVIGGNA